VQIVKVLKASPACSGLSKLLCNDTGHEYETFSFHTKSFILMACVIAKHVEPHINIK